MIDDLYEDGTAQVFADLARRAPPPPPPKPPGFFAGLADAPRRAIGAGTARAIAFASEIAGAFGSVGGAYPEIFGVEPTPEQKTEAAAARKKLLESGPSYSNEVGDVFRQQAAEYMPDPKTSGLAAQMVAGFGSFATEVGLGAFVAGPLAPAFVGGSAAFDEADRLKQQGVDLGTRAKAGAVTGAVTTAMTALPMAGATRAARAATGLAIGEGGMVGQQAAVQHILRAAGYDQIAQHYDPFDPALLAAGAVPGLLGLIGRPRAVGPLKSEADVRTAAQFTPAEQAHSDAYERSDANLKELRVAITREADPAKKAILEAELNKLGEPRDAVVDAARAAQVEAEIQRARVTPAEDIAGHNAHVEAVQAAHEQIARGEPVNVGEILGEHPLDPVRLGEAADRVKEGADRVEHLGPEPWDLPPARIAIDELPAVADRAEDLRAMANAAGWASEGGKMLRAPVKPGEGIVGEVTGRTPWIPGEEWYGRMRSELGKSGLSNRGEIQAAVEKAIAGEKLKAKEQRTVDWIRQESEEMRLAFRAREFVPDEADLATVRAMAEGLGKEHAIDTAMVAKAYDVDRAAVEAAHEATPGDDAAFMERIRRIVDGDKGTGEPARGDASSGASPARAQGREEGSSRSGEPGEVPQHAQAFEQRLEQLGQDSPDLPVVGPDGERTTLGEAVQRINDEFAAEAKDAQLAQVAADCALRNA